MSLKNFFIIAAGLFSPKLILFAAAYLYTPVDYNNFNKVYYTASLIILFASLGYNMSINRIKLKNSRLFSLVFAGSLITGLVLYFIFRQVPGPAELLYITVYTFVSSVIGIFTFQLLFESKIYKHFLLIFLSTFAHIICLAANIYIKADFYKVFLAIAVISAAACYWLIPQNDEKGDVKKFISLGFSAFLINSVVPFALVLDKYIASHYFRPETANAYAFAWALIAPLFYAGNIVERLIFSSGGQKKRPLFIKAVLLQCAIIAAYIITVQMVFSYLPALLPKSVDKMLCREIFTFMAAGYSVYILFQFPVNGVLFKFYSAAKQNVAGITHLLLAAVFVIVLSFMFSKQMITGYQVLLYVIWGFIFLTLAAKSVVMFFDKLKTNNKARLET